MPKVQLYTSKCISSWSTPIKRLTSLSPINAKQTVDHLFPNCPMAMEIWWVVLNLLDYSWVFPSSLQSLFEAWVLGAGTKKGKLLWRFSLWMLCGLYWRNVTGGVLMEEHLLGSPLWKRSNSSSLLGLLFSLLIDLLMRNWKEFPLSPSSWQDCLPLLFCLFGFFAVYIWRWCSCGQACLYSPSTVSF